MYSTIDNDLASEACAAMIRGLGARATPARVAVLDLLERAGSALSHHDVESALAGQGFDRVTLYRVLEWMEQVGLAHRTVDTQRVFRYSTAAQSPEHETHAHFRCDECGKVYCLEQVHVSSPQLPEGFSGKAVEFCISGHCAQCQSSGKTAASRKTRSR